MFDLYAEITNRFIAELDKGRIPWKQPWKNDGGAMAISRMSGRAYSFLNQMLLHFRPGEYLTFKQCSEEGGRIRKGEKGHMIVFTKWVDKRDGSTITLPDGSVVPEQVPFLRYYTVWHVDQTDCIKPKWDKPVADPIKPDERAEKILQDYVARSGIKFIRSRSNDAFYRPSTDEIHVPEINQFTEVAEAYACYFHEGVHGSGHPSRLNRITDVAAFGSENYSKEELVAEIGSAFLVNIAGLETPSQFRNSAGYIQGWLNALKNDKKLIVTAAAKAQKAVEYILGNEAGEEKEHE